MTRAMRRHLAERKKQRVAGYSTCFTPDMIGLRAKTPCPCSCFMCGTPRRHTGERTRKEDA